MVCVRHQICGGHAHRAFPIIDATPLRTLAIRTRIDHTQQSVPSITQRTPLSFLQKFVKDARKVILDPVFENLSAPADIVAFSNSTFTSNSHINSSSSNDPNHTPILTLPSPLSEDENEEHRQEPAIHESMTVIRKRERARANIRELKKRKIRTNPVSGCKLGEDGLDGVFVRNDVEDESAEVDMSMELPQSCISMPLDDPLDQVSDPMDVDSASVLTLEDAMHCSTKPPNLPRTHHPVVPQRDIVNRTSRTRKPSLKLQFQSLPPLTEPENEPTATPTPSQSLGKRSRDIAEINATVCKPKSEPLATSEVNAETDKSRSDTYKQAWTVSEQHLLERLLEEIPDGERNRHVPP